MKENILVTGATGQVGSHLVRLLSERNVAVKAATRSPGRARERLRPPVDVVELDYGRADTYDAALEWADRVFVVAPPFHPRAPDLMHSFVDWAVSAGTGHVVLLSAMGVEARDDLALRQVERMVEETGADWTFLRPNVYMQNFNPGFLGRDIRRHGRFHLPVGDARVSLVDARDVASVAAEILTSDDHRGVAYTLTGPQALDHHRIAEVISDAAGRTVEYVPATDEAMHDRLLDRGWDEDHTRVVLDFVRSIRSGARETVTDDVEAVLGRAPGSFEAFAHENAPAWREEEDA